MSIANKKPCTSFVDTYFGFVADQVSDLSMQFDQAVSRSNAFIDELAVRGEAVEADIKKSIPRNVKMNKSIKNWFEALSFGSAKRDAQLDELSTKVDRLIDTVALLAEKKAQQAKQTATKEAQKSSAKEDTPVKAASKPTPIKRAAKATKATATKTAAAKPATRKPRASAPKATDSE